MEFTLEMRNKAPLYTDFSVQVEIPRLTPEQIANYAQPNIPHI
jgi:hypothetical protein